MCHSKTNAFNSGKKIQKMYLLIEVTTCHNQKSLWNYNLKLNNMKNVHVACEFISHLLKMCFIYPPEFNDY